MIPLKTGQQLIKTSKDAFRIKEKVKEPAPLIIKGNKLKSKVLIHILNPPVGAPE